MAINQDPLAALGLLIRKFGQRIDGGWEVFIPEKTIQELGHAQIQVEPDASRKGFKFKVFLNKVVEGELKQNTDLPALLETKDDKGINGL